MDFLSVGATLDNSLVNTPDSRLSTPQSYIYTPNKSQPKPKQSRGSTNGRPFQCTYEGCTTTFTQSSALIVHMRTHTGEKPFRCTYYGCRAAFTQSSALTAHIRTHTGEKPFKCTYNGCSAAFKQSSALTVHNRTHTGEKPFRCTYAGCTAAFTNSPNLGRHIRVHERQKPFRCSYSACNTSVSSQSSSPKVVSHTRTNSREGSFRCTYNGCRQTFPFASDLTSHILTHMVEKPPEIAREDTTSPASAYIPLLDLTSSTDYLACPKPLDYKCTFIGCGAAFACASNLTSHILTHMVENPLSNINKYQSSYITQPPFLNMLLCNPDDNRFNLSAKAAR